MASRNEDRLPDLGPSQAAEVRLFSELASVATSRTSSMGALQQCLYLVCAYVGWPVGHLYLTASDASGELAPSKVWYLADPEEFEVLRSVTEKTRFSPGIGLPGRVLSSGEPEWIPDVQEDENFPRAQLAQDIGVRGAFAFPVKVGSDTIGVLEFFTKSRTTQDDSILRVMRLIGPQIGRIVERIRAEEELADVVAELRRDRERSEILFSVAKIFSEPGRFTERVTRALEEVASATDVDSAHLRMPDHKEEGLRLVAAVGEGIDERPPAALTSYADTRGGRAFKTGEPIIENDYTQQPGRGRSIAAMGAQSAAWLPVKAAGRIMGVLTVISTRPGYFIPQRVQLLTAIANGFGTFVENANLREADRLQMEELDRELQAAIKRSEMRLGEAFDREHQPVSSPSDRVLRYLDDHPEGANFDTLQTVADISARGIVPIMARLLDEGKVRHQFPLFLPAK